MGRRIPFHSPRTLLLNTHNSSVWANKNHRNFMQSPLNDQKNHSVVRIYHISPIIVPFFFQEMRDSTFVTFNAARESTSIRYRIKSFIAWLINICWRVQFLCGLLFYLILLGVQKILLRMSFGDDRVLRHYFPNAWHFKFPKSESVC